jgi:CheY-like chemotaxis protein
MGIRVLVVDDDKDLLTLIDKFLVKEQPDFEVISTISAQDAIRKLEEEHFDAIVCDYYLGVGEMNGLELLEWLRASNSTIPFIMFTGRSREEVAIRALNLGADLYLKKDQEDLGNLFVELVHHIKSSVESAQIEKTLWEERHKFQKYLDVARVMILALDSDGRVTLMNRRGCEILGCDHDEVIGKDWFKTFLPKRLRKKAVE